MRKPETPETKDLLDQALMAWRQAEADGGERLSPATRERILGATASPDRGRLAPLGSLFVPTWKLALGTTLPAIGLAAVLGGLWSQESRRPDAAGLARHGDQARVAADKSGDEVVFVIANGRSTHRVTRTDDPRRNRGDEGTVVTDGTYRDELSGGSEVVYYRID
jgi:hypothetical protein